MHPAELFRHDSDGVELAKGETLFHEGDRGNCMYVLLEGSADVRVGEMLVESATPGGPARRNGPGRFQSAHCNRDSDGALSSGQN